MKVGIEQLREMVLRAVQAMRTEAKKKGGKQDIPERTPEFLASQGAKKVPKGFSYAPSLDGSEPLGDANRYKRQGASGMGGWTAESVNRKPASVIQLEKLVEMVVREEIRKIRG